MVRARHPQQGITLVESLAVLVICGLLAGAALPSLQEARAARQADASAAQLRTALQHARSLAVAEGRLMTVSFANDTSGSCYVVYSGPRSSCTCSSAGEAICVAGARGVRSVYAADHRQTSFRSSAPDVSFDATHGTVTPTATVRVQSERGEERHVVISLTGRTRTCTLGSPSFGIDRC